MQFESIKEADDAGVEDRRKYLREVIERLLTKGGHDAGAAMQEEDESQ